jgi:O-methyltransferase
MDRNIFINQATNIDLDTTKNREIIADKFEDIHKNINCAHCIADPYHMADYILKNHNIQGSIIEFGCFKGGMSAKLSIVAKLTNKKYVVFDSFEGLPINATYKMWDENIHDAILKKNDYAGTFEEVEENIKKYGSLESCQFIKGLIEHTLPNFEEDPFFVFIDVDIIETARFIIKQLWNRLKGHLMFTHESCIKDYINGIMDEKWWNINIGTNPPSLGSTLLKTGHALEKSGCLDCLIKY